MVRILGYMACSLDGFVADARGGLDWLSPYGDMDLGPHGHEVFLERIGTVVMGRATYDFIVRSGEAWPYGRRRALVATSRPIADPVGGVEPRADLDALIAELRALSDGDVWMLGGGRLQMAFLERGALDELELFVMPELIGGGPPALPPTGLRASPRLISAKALGRGCVRLHYAFDGAGD